MMYESTVQRTDGIAVRTEGLGKRYGDLWALRDLDLEVPTGTILGLLGHNGAGKTTAIRILTTLTIPTTGRATVAGLDVVADAKRVRTQIGLAGQSAAVDGLMSGRANLEMIGRLHHLPRNAAAARALAPFADDPETRDEEALAVTVPLRGRPPLVELVRALDAADVDVTDLARREPSLDDVFLALTDPTREEAA